jgi:hypothetical protein
MAAINNNGVNGNNQYRNERKKTNENNVMAGVMAMWRNQYQ